jgi:hypothetical protein
VIGAKPALRAWCICNNFSKYNILILHVVLWGCFLN